MTDTKTRPVPPPLEFRCPDCPLCLNETYHDGDGFRCDPCSASWDSNGNDDGNWDDEDAEQCDATAQPLADNPFASDEQRAKTYRCSLTAGHEAKHASVDGWTGSVKGWA